MKSIAALNLLLYSAIGFSHNLNYYALKVLRCNYITIFRSS